MTDAMPTDPFDDDDDQAPREMPRYQQLDDGTQRFLVGITGTGDDEDEWSIATVYALSHEDDPVGVVQLRIERNRPDKKRKVLSVVLNTPAVLELSLLLQQAGAELMQRGIQNWRQRS